MEPFPRRIRQSVSVALSNKRADRLVRSSCLLPRDPEIGIFTSKSAAIPVNLGSGENTFVPAKVMRRIIAATTFAIAAWTTPVIAKECYAPDARAQERAFSRAVTTEGGKVVWLGGQTGSPNLNSKVRSGKASLSWIRPSRRSEAAA